MTTSAPKKQFVFTPASGASAALCRQRFLIDNIDAIYTVDVLKRVNQTIETLGSVNYDLVSTSRTWEHLIADVLRRAIPTMVVAETQGFSNAMGFDVFDMSPTGNHFVEVKDYGVSLGSGSIKACPDTDGKFCTLAVVVVDENIPEGYAIYAIPPQAISSDTAKTIDIPHHNGKYTDSSNSTCIAITRDELGGSVYGKYRIKNLAELVEKFDIFANINMKNLASAIRKTEAGTNTQKMTLSVMTSLFHRCVATGTKNWASTNSSKVKPVKDWNDPMYNITEDKETNSRIFFNGKTFDLVNWPDVPTRAKTLPKTGRTSIKFSELATPKQFKGVETVSVK